MSHLTADGPRSRPISISNAAEPAYGSGEGDSISTATAPAPARPRPAIEIIANLRSAPRGAY